MRSAMSFQEKKLYHQIHPLKLATDIGTTIPSLYMLWEHELLLGLLVMFIPPILVSAAMMMWPPDLERIKRSRFGHYIKQSMIPAIETVRVFTLLPMAYGAWAHQQGYNALGFVVLLAAWSNGLMWKRAPGAN